MRRLIREENSFGNNPSTKDLVRHLYTRMFCGEVVMVVKEPMRSLPALRKQWLKLARKTQTQRARTLNPVRIQALSTMVARMQSLHFASSWSAGDCPADVYVITLDQALCWSPDCRTLYVTCDIEPKELHRITTSMPKGSLVVLCKLHP